MGAGRARDGDAKGGDAKAKMRGTRKDHTVAPAIPPPPEVADKRKQIDDLREEFRAAQLAADAVVSPAGPPRRLHHYTTLNGLTGITSSSSVWASDVRYMNDASELSYAVDLIAELVRGRLAEVGNDMLRPLLPTRFGFANAFEYGARPFVACFCEEEDLLSQWRGYRAGETGYSLGMDLSLVATVGDLPPNTYLRKVIYDPDVQRQQVGDVVDIWLETAASLLTADRGLHAEDVFPYPAIWALQEALAEHHLCFKHPAFAEEREWRLIKLVDVREELRLLDQQRTEEMLRATNERMRGMGVEIPDVRTAWGEARAEGIDIGFRPSSVGLVPYVALPLRDRAGVFTGRLPLWQVIQGPTANPELALESLRMYLESGGYGFHTEVRPSQIPLRE